MARDGSAKTNIVILLSSLPISMEEFNHWWKNVLISNEKRRKVLRLELKKKLLQNLQRCFPFYGTIAIPPLKPLGLGICKEGLWKADPSENPITQWDLWGWIIWVWDAVTMGLLNWGGILAQFSLSGRDNSTIRKLSKITHQMCLSNTLDFTQIPYLNTQSRFEKGKFAGDIHLYTFF